MADRSIAREGEDHFRDGLLWIGGTYRSIECDSETNCAVPGGPAELAAVQGQARCFVHEAEWRGISRKIASVPRWAVPGQSRIFLVHRGGATAAHHGKIFGYFVLHRVEVLGKAGPDLAPPDVQQELPWGGPAGQGELTVTVYDALTGRPLRGAEVEARGPAGEPPTLAEAESHSYRLSLPAVEHRLTVSMLGYQSTDLDGVRVPSGKRRKVAVYLQPGPRAVEEGREGDERTVKCWDGSTIVTHRFENGRWRATRQRCPEPEEEPECEEGAVEWSICPDGALIPARICLAGRWSDTGVRCKAAGPKEGEPPEPEPTPIDVEPFAPHRSCSLRLRPGAVYLVDALGARINDDFAAGLRRKGLPARYKEASDDSQRWSLVLEGRRVFVEIADKVSTSWKARTKLARQLAGRAKVRGELVLLDEVVTFVKKPRAAFRSLERIDGEHLLDQIAAGVREPTIRVYAPPAGKEKTLTKGEIVARLAERERASLSAVEQLLGGLAQLVRQELGSGGPGAVRLPGIGTLRAGAAPRSLRPAKRPDLESGLAARLPADPVTREPVLSPAAVHRLLDRLAALVGDELRTAGTMRLPRIGTFRRRGERLNFAPSKSLGVDAVTFGPQAS